MPHAGRGFGVFAETAQHLTDVLNQFEHALKLPVEAIPFLFSLLDAGVEFTSVGTPTWLILIGKPIGIFSYGWLGTRVIGLGLPPGTSLRDVLVVGFVTASGFTVALFVAGVAFSPEATLAGVPVQDAAKLGVLAGPIAFVVRAASGGGRDGLKGAAA